VEEKIYIKVSVDRIPRIVFASASGRRDEYRRVPNHIQERVKVLIILCCPQSNIQSDSDLLNMLLRSPVELVSKWCNAEPWMEKSDSVDAIDCTGSIHLRILMASLLSTKEKLPSLSASHFSCKIPRFLRALCSDLMTSLDLSTSIHSA